MAGIASEDLFADPHAATEAGLRLAKSSQFRPRSAAKKVDATTRDSRSVRPGGTGRLGLGTGRLPVENRQRV